MIRPIRYSAFIFAFGVTAFSLLNTHAYAADAGANESCSVSGSPSEEFRLYQTNLKKELANINTHIQAISCSTNSLSNTSLDNERAKATNLMYDVVNQTRDLKLLDASFRFNITRLLSLGEDLPLLKRERNTLKNQAVAIEKSIDQVFAKCAGESVFQGKKLEKYISNIYADHIKFTAYFEGVASGLPQGLSTNVPNIVASDANFISKIGATYSAEGLKACNTKSLNDKWRAIQNVWKVSENISRGTRSWQEGWELMQGNSDASKQKTKALLSDYLAKNNITGDQRDSIMKKLQCSQSKAQGCGGLVDVIGSEKIQAQFEKLNLGMQDLAAGAQRIFRISQGYRGVDGDLPPDVSTLMGVESFEQERQEIQASTLALHQSLLKKQQSGIVDSASRDTLITINEQIYAINTLLLKIKKISEANCNRQDTGKGNCEN